jgi:hypothetical protein
VQQWLCPSEALFGYLFSYRMLYKCTGLSELNESQHNLSIAMLFTFPSNTGQPGSMTIFSCTRYPHRRHSLVSLYSKLLLARLIPSYRRNGLVVLHSSQTTYR